jgi:plastocyanin
MIHMTRLSALLVVLALALAACGGSDESADTAADDTAPVDAPAVDAPAVDAPVDDAPVDDAPADDAAAAADGSTVTISGFRFDPKETTVAVGDTVTWSNEDGINHTATSGTPDDPDGLFDLEMPEAGITAEHTFEEAGTFVYFCDIHKSMLGEVTVS